MELWQLCNVLKYTLAATFISFTSDDCFSFVGYALLLSPNYTPSRDTVFIEKLVGLRRDEFALNTLYSCLFNAMGIYPLIFLALIQPSGQSGNKVETFSTFTG